MSLFLEMPTAPAVAGVAPVVTSNPAIVGSPIVGVTLDFGNGTATGIPFPAVQNWAWQTSADGNTPWTQVATTHTYTLVVGDATRLVRLIFDWVNASGTASAVSPTIGPVVDPVSPPGPVSPPVIS